MAILTQSLEVEETAARMDLQRVDVANHGALDVYRTPRIVRALKVKVILAVDLNVTLVARPPTMNTCR